MNYSELYRKLIDSELSKPQTKSERDEYCEWHHIIPRCLGGVDDNSNLVLLSGKAHFVAHHLLWRIHPNHGGLVKSFHLMVHGFHNDRYVTAREFPRLKEAYSKSVSVSNSQRTLSQTHRDNIAKSHDEHWANMSSERRAEISAMHTGKTLSVETRAKISEANTGENHYFYGKSHSDETKAKLSANVKAQWANMSEEEKARRSSKGSTWSDETKLRVANRPKIECPHCDASGRQCDMTRWHFDNCKFKEQEDV